MNSKQYSRFTHASSALVSQHDRLSAQAGAVARNVASGRLRALLSPVQLVVSLLAMAFAIFLLSLPLYATHLFAPSQDYHSVRAHIVDVEEHQTMAVNIPAWEPAYHTSCRYSLSYKSMNSYQTQWLMEEKVGRFSYRPCQEAGGETRIWLPNRNLQAPEWEPPGPPWGAYLAVVIVGAVTLTISTRFSVAWLGVKYRASKYTRDARRTLHTEGEPYYLDVIEDAASRNFDKFLNEKNKKPKKKWQYGNPADLFT